MTSTKIDIDPRAMAEFMDRCVDVQRTQRESVIGSRPKCQACDNPGVSIPCTCHWSRIQA